RTGCRSRSRRCTTCSTAGTCSGPMRMFAMPAPGRSSTREMAMNDRAAVEDPLGEADASVRNELGGLENRVARHFQDLSAGSWRPTSDELIETFQGLRDQVEAIRRGVESLRQAQRDEGRRVAHDVRAALNAIAGWTHVLRLEKNPSERVAHATDVLDRNVRALAGVIEAAER